MLLHSQNNADILSCVGMEISNEMKAYKEPIMAQTATEPKKNTDPSQNMFERATEDFKSTMDAGIRCQRDMMQFMFGGFDAGKKNDDVRRDFRKTATESIELVRKNAEQIRGTVDQNCRLSADAVNKTFDTFENGRDKDADVFEQGRSAWKIGADAMCSTLENVSKTNVQIVENWSSFIDQCMRSGKVTAK